jgi:hypothetical protein
LTRRLLRYVLADTEHLHKKMAEMAQRIRQLEDALAVFQAEVSSETHPLLSDGLLSIKYGPEVHKEASNHGAVDETLEALGTLAINEDGEAKYYGHIAGSEVGNTKFCIRCSVADVLQRPFSL